MKRINFLLIGLLFVGTGLVSSCDKEETPNTPNTQNDPSICTGTDVATNTWAVIHLDGKTSTVQMDEASIPDNAYPVNDKYRYSFDGDVTSGPNETGPGGNAISFSFKGDTPPASGTYTLNTTGTPTANEVYVSGFGAGTGSSGGGLFPVSGSFTVINNNGVVTIKGKGVKFRTAMSLKSNLCASFNITK